MATLKKQFKTQQEKEGHVFISADGYTHPGWVRLGTMTKARNNYAKILGENIRNFQTKISLLEDETWVELVRKDGKNLTRQEKKYLKDNPSLPSTKNANLAGFRNATQSNMRTIFTSPDYMPGTNTQTESRKAWDNLVKKQKAGSYLRQGRFGFKAGGRIDRSKPKYPKLLRNKEYTLGFKAYFDKSAFVKQAETLTQGVNMLAYSFLGETVHATVQKTRKDINAKPGTSKTRHFKKKSRWGKKGFKENDTTSFIGTAHKLQGDAINRIAHSLYGNLKELKGQNTRNYSRYITFVIGSFDEGDSPTNPTGARGSRMKKGEKSLTELREDSQSAFTVKPNVGSSPLSKTTAYYLGKGTRINRRQGLSGRTFRKQLKGQ